MTDTSMTIDLDTLFNKQPDLMLLEFLHSKYVRQYPLMHAAVLFEYTDLYTKEKVTFSFQRTSLSNESETPEEVQ